jgi:hypothetical protein
MKIMLARNAFTRWLHPNNNNSNLTDLRKGQFMSISLPAFSGIRVLTGLAWITLDKKAVVVRGGEEYWTRDNIDDARISAEGDRRVQFETLSDWLVVTHEEGRVPVTILSIRGCLDWTTYELIIERAQQLLQSGTDYLLVDLREISALSNVGLIALHNLWRMAGGQQPTNIEDGWSALHTLEADCQQGPHQPYFKVVAPQPSYLVALEKRGLTNLFDVCYSMDAALDAF